MPNGQPDEFPLKSLAMPQENSPSIRSFVIRAARTSSGQKKALEELWPLYGIPFTGESLNLAATVAQGRKLVVEIGFGNGEATIELAEKQPQTCFVGIEVHPPGVGQVLRKIHERQLKNLKLIRFDAVQVLEKEPSDSVDGFHIFFPDPWPKKKHHKRRLVQLPFVRSLIRVLKPGGYIYFASDWEEYSQDVLALLGSQADLKNPFDGFAQELDWRPSTKFENRGIAEGRPIREIYFFKHLGQSPL